MHGVHGDWRGLEAARELAHEEHVGELRVGVRLVRCVRVRALQLRVLQEVLLSPHVQLTREHNDARAPGMEALAGALQQVEKQVREQEVAQVVRLKAYLQAIFRQTSRPRSC